ncbi:hypothetical protein HNV28_32080 [Myxococcus xanthus]|uniref:JAB domain-containing protein n=1 Tax=Myxococcus xanthus TaxID=34 RepID=A0A7Y4MUQ6_MYXXA|nr:hypothetical protein [Myxococcus xanthus]NOJ90184.1 hypothetical protein [Myxococcus xanthus]
MRKVTSLVFRRPNGGQVAVSECVVQLLIRHRQIKDRDHEAGGVLLGRCIVDSENIVVDQASEPTGSDIRSRFRFFRSKSPAQRLVDDAWASSNGTMNYLGEWHSHPETHPHPSTVDLENWRWIASRAVLEQNFLLFLIVGIVSTQIWELDRHHMTVQQLQPVSFSA